MKSTLRYIYFDIDDTLLDHRSAEKRALQCVHLQFEELSHVDLTTLQSEYHNINSKLWMEYGSGKIDRKTLQFNRFNLTLSALGVHGLPIDEVGNFYMKSYRDHWEWIEHSRITLDEIRAIWPVGFLTNGFAETQRLKAERFGLYSISQNYIVSEEVGFMKPSTQIFEYATDKAGVPAESIMYVGDSYTSDIIGGRSYGWHTAWYTRSIHSDQANDSCLVFDDFRNLPELLKNYVHK